MRLTRLLWLMFAFYLTYVGGASYYNTIFAVRIAHHALVTVILGCWLLGRLRHRSQIGLPRSGLEAPLLAFLAVVGLNIVAALDPRMAFEHAWFVLVHITILFMMVDLLQTGRQRLLMEVMFFMAAVAVLISGWEFTAWYLGLGIIPGTEVGWINTGNGLLPSLNILPRLFLAMGVSTLLAGYLAPLVTLSLGWALTTARRDYRIVLMGLAGVLLLALLMTGSRGGLLGAGTALGAFGVFQLIRWPRLTQYISARIIVRMAVVVGIASAISFVVLTLPRGLGTSNSGRLDMWRSAIVMTADHPLLGVGYGLFGRAFRDYRDPAQVQDKLAHAHNLYLNTLSELGIAGAAIVLWLGFVAARLAWRNYHSISDRPRQMRLEAVLCALLGYGTHSLVESFSITPIIFMVLAMVAYSITPLPISRLIPRPSGSRLLTASLLVLLMGWYAVKFQFDRAQTHYMQAFSRETAANALADLDAAHSIDPSLRLYPLAQAYVLDVADDPTAIVAYEEALRLEPTWDIGWANLALLYAQQGRTQEAFAAVDRAYRLNYNTPALFLWASLAEDTQAADEQTIVDRYVGAMADHFTFQRELPLEAIWHDTPLRRRALAQYADLIGLDNQYRLWAVHDPTRLATLVPPVPLTAADWWVVGQYALDTGRPAEAVTAFEQAVTLYGSWMGSGDYNASLARAQIADGIPDMIIGETLRQADFYGTWLEDTAALWQQVAPDQAVTVSSRPIRLNAIEFAAVMYSRPALFDFVTDMQNSDR